MEKIQLKTIKKILKDHLPKKKGEEIGDLAEGLHKWLHTNKNYKKVEKIVKDGCSKQKGGGKTRKRKRKRKKRTRSRRGGNGDEEWWNNAAFTGMAVMVGFGMYLLFELFPPNNPLRRFRQRRSSPSEGERKVEETPLGAIHAAIRTTHVPAIQAARAQGLDEGTKATDELIGEGLTEESAEHARTEESAAHARDGDY